MTMSILELLQHIVNEPAPRLNNGPGGEGRFPKMADNFVECCLLKDPDERWTPKDLLVRLAFAWIYLCDADSFGVRNMNGWIMRELRMWTLRLGRVCSELLLFAPLSFVLLFTLV